MRRLEHDGRRDTRVQGLLPAVRAQAPAVARLEPRKPPLGVRCREVVADACTEDEELLRHDSAHGVDAEILAARTAAPVAPEAGQRVEAAGLEWSPEDIATFRSHSGIISRPR